MRTFKQSLLSLLCCFFFSCAGQFNTLDGATTNLANKVNNQIPDPTDVDATDSLSKLKYIYSTRYILTTVYTKQVDDHGDGYENLYGVRNFRAVLSGIYYRGGGNNKYNRDGVRSNVNPLPNNALENLCKEGFSEAIYYYAENYNTAPPIVRCTDRFGRSNTLIYNQVSALKATNHEVLLKKIFDRIKNPLVGPIYGHCWNGWHASGLIAALALRQFCGWTGAQAEAYWIKNTDGNDDVNYDSIKTTIKNYTVKSNMALTSIEKSIICPTP